MFQVANVLDKRAFDRVMEQYFLQKPVGKTGGKENTTVFICLVKSAES